MANIDSIKDALCDVRKAHRIIYAYQKRMMGIVRFIGKKLDFPVCEGYKWFSNGASKRISSGTWAWDYIYSYLLEYYLGEKKSPDGIMDYALRACLKTIVNRSEFSESNYNSRHHEHFVG